MKSFVLAATFATMGFAAQAAPLDPLQILQSYNAISLGDFNMTSSHVEGTMYVGGNLNSANATDVNSDNQVPSVLGAALVVGGNVTGGQVRVLYGDADIGGSANGVVAMNGGGTLTEGASIDTAGVTAAMEGLSSYLSGLATTAGASYNSADQNNPLSLGTGDADGFVVLNLSESEAVSFFANNLNSLNASSYNGVFINVAGNSFSRSGNWNAQSNNVILNMFEATSFTNANGNMNMSVLSPFADVTLAGSGMNGFVVGASITNRAEIRPPYTSDPINYSGGLPPQVAPVPLPAAGWMMFGALAGLAGLRRRSRGA